MDQKESRCSVRRRRADRELTSKVPASVSPSTASTRCLGDRRATGFSRSPRRRSSSSMVGRPAYPRPPTRMCSGGGAGNTGEHSRRGPVDVTGELAGVDGGRHSARAVRERTRRFGIGVDPGARPLPGRGHDRAEDVLPGAVPVDRCDCAPTTVMDRSYHVPDLPAAVVVIQHQPVLVVAGAEAGTERTVLARLPPDRTGGPFELDPFDATIVITRALRIRGADPELGQRRAVWSSRIEDRPMPGRGSPPSIGHILYAPSPLEPTIPLPSARPDDRRTATDQSAPHRDDPRRMGLRDRR